MIRSEHSPRAAGGLWPGFSARAPVCKPLLPPQNKEVR